VEHSLCEAAFRGVPAHKPKGNTIQGVIRVASQLRSPFSFLFARTSREERVAAYVIREHGLGRSLDDILGDRYIQNRLTPLEQHRLLDRPELIRALGDDMIAEARRDLPTPA
jgi:hypothetical protein